MYKKIKILSLILFYLSIQHSPIFAENTLQTTRPIIFTKPVELDWRAVAWPSANYERIPVDGGAAIYSLPSENALKFKINFIFPGGIYSLEQNNRPTFDAMTDLLLLGGFGNLNFDEIQNFAVQYGINLETSISPEGYLIIGADGLTQDFPKVIDLLANMILNPRFEESSLAIWKQQSKDTFQQLLNANTYSKQIRFIDHEAMSLAFGEKHYLASTFLRFAPANLNLIKYEQIKQLYKIVINKNGLNVSLAGKFSSKDLSSLQTLITKIPTLEPAVQTWLPSRDMAKITSKIQTEIILKPDMTQCNISLRYYFPELAKLNSIEKTQIDILKEVFSSSGGTIGNDRFSKALRASSGISYSPYAYFNDLTVYPNTNVGMFGLNFQSANERITEAIQLATKTWDIFLLKGITDDEFNDTRTAMINRMLAKELTIFDKSTALMSRINKDHIPYANPIETTLVKLDKQRNKANIDETLKRLAKEQIVPILVIMGNPSQDQIAQLKKIVNIELINVKKFSDITQSLL